MKKRKSLLMKKVINYGYILEFIMTNGLFGMKRMISKKIMVICTLMRMGIL